MTTVEQIQAQLEKAYIPPLDPTTLLAIQSEYDVTDTAQLRSLQQVLDVITSDAGEEGASGFDPTASSRLSVNNASRYHAWECSVSGGSYTQDGIIGETTINPQTLLPNFARLGLSESEISSSNDGLDESYTSALDELDDESKMSFLTAMFPALRPIDIQLSMKGHKSHQNLVIDDLMTQSFLEETGDRQRGIDGLAESEGMGKLRKHRRSRIKQEALPVPSTPQMDQWDLATKDTTFIATMTGIPLPKVCSLYHENGLSLRATILTILESHRMPLSSLDEPTITMDTHRLAREFPSLSPHQASALSRLTHPFSTNAYELAKALSAPPIPNEESSKIPIKIELHHKPIHIHTPTNTASGSVSAMRPSNPVSPSASGNVPSYTLSRDAAFAQASAASRRSRSNPLMGGVAAHYSQVGRDFNTRAKKAYDDAIEASVLSRSSKNLLDLHGADVKNAVRISRERVNAWWLDYGRGSQEPRGNAGLEIITGVGRHSAGGKPKVGPAVAKMLMREGWKFEDLGGALIVRGVTGER